MLHVTWCDDSFTTESVTDDHANLWKVTMYSSIFSFMFCFRFQIINWRLSFLKTSFASYFFRIEFEEKRENGDA